MDFNTLKYPKKSSEMRKNLKQRKREYSGSILTLSEVWRKAARAGLPVLFALLVTAVLAFHARLSDDQIPAVKNGILDLEDWNEKKAFSISGELEFYWDSLLNYQEIREAIQTPIPVYAPDKWNHYEISGSSLPGKGKATYRISVTGAKAGVQYGIRIQDMASVYRLYMNDTLIAQNGNFGDTESAPASAYRPQLVAFTPANSSFDMILQVSNDALAFGGMWEPVIFGTYRQVADFDRLISNIGASVMASLSLICLFSLIFFAAQRGEKDMFIFLGISLMILLRFMSIGDEVLALIFPEMPIAYMYKVTILSFAWTQLLLLYFVYCTYGSLVPRWQVTALLAYSIGLSVFAMLFPLDIVTSAYTILNFILLFVIAAIAVHLTRAAWQGREGAPLLLGALWLIFLMVIYEVLWEDNSTYYYLLTNLHFEYMLFALAQVTVVALRYRRAQRLEIEHLRGQIRPHFIHNALTSIISISRTEPDRARELLVDFSSYLRGFYDFDRDELVSFTQELELVQAYAALEQARFGDKLRVEYSLEIEDFLMPTLLLQPLVENAFSHGLCGKDDGGTVTIYTKNLKNGRIRVGVRDDGVGFSEKNASARRGIAVENINRRLSYLYRTSLVFTIPEGGGCEVYFDISYKEAAKHEGTVN